MKKIVAGLMLFSATVFSAITSEDTTTINMRAMVGGEENQIIVDKSDIDFGQLKGRTGNISEPFNVTIKATASVQQLQIYFPTHPQLVNEKEEAGKQNRIEVQISENNGGYGNGQYTIPLGSTKEITKTYYAVIRDQTINAINNNNYVEGEYTGSFTMRVVYEIW